MYNSELVPQGGSFSSQAISRLSGPLVRQANKEIERLVARGLVAEATERGRAYVANVALEEIGALSSLEAHLTELTPHAAGRYAAIVDAYTVGAARTISRWS